MITENFPYIMPEDLNPKYLYYLASPYSAPDAYTRFMNFLTVAEKAALLIKAGIPVYSPIAHCHGIHTVCSGEKPTHAQYLHIDTVMISRCDHLLICDMHGWRESSGILHEISYAQSLSIPINMLSI